MTLQRRLLAALAGLCFVGYPGLRPWSSTAPQDVAASLADPRWPLTHLLAMAGFVLLALLLRPGAAPAADRSAARTGVLAWLAASLLLPYYGAEALALHVLGRRVQAGGDPTLLALADDFRYSPWGLALFVPGLLLLAVVGVRLGWSCWAGGGLPRLAGALVAVGLLTFLPQFFTPAGPRVVHGLVLGAGLLLLAVAGPRLAAGGAAQDRGTAAQDRGTAGDGAHRRASVDVTPATATGGTGR